MVFVIFAMYQEVSNGLSARFSLPSKFSVATLATGHALIKKLYPTCPVTNAKDGTPLDTINALFHKPEGELCPWQFEHFTAV